MVGRRVNIAAPAESLLLLKATGQVPHTGGKLFDISSPLYQTVHRWIEAGAPDDAESVPQPVEIMLAPERMVFNGPKGTEQTKVTARYSDGSTRDVTADARYSSSNENSAEVDEAGLVRLDDRDPQSRVGTDQVVRGPQAGVPASDDRDVGIRAPRQRLAQGCEEIHRQGVPPQGQCAKPGIGGCGGLVDIAHRAVQPSR